MGKALMLMPSAARLPGGEVLGLAYGLTVSDKAAGAGDRTCLGIYKWLAGLTAADGASPTSYYNSTVIGYNSTESATRRPTLEINAPHPLGDALSKSAYSGRVLWKQWP